MQGDINFSRPQSNIAMQADEMNRLSARATLSLKFFLFSIQFPVATYDFFRHYAYHLARVLTGRGPGLSHSVPTVREG
jgi:hypothetical protein